MFHSYTNRYARWSRALAILICVFGITAAFVFWIGDAEDHSSLTTLFSTAITALLLRGFAEIIEILYRIHQRLEADAARKGKIEEDS